MRTGTPQQIRRESSGEPVLRRFAAGLRTQALVAPGDRVVVAVSGGPDSMALLSLLREAAPAWRLTLHAVHVNHALRGAESEEDAAFVSSMCRRLGVELSVERHPLKPVAGFPSGRSVQERAREARYGALVRTAEKLEGAKIALGHTADDQAETVLLWMLRGAGIRGLSGIPPVREGRFIRPLLQFSRKELLAYLEGRGLRYRVDSSNAKTVYLRNRIRHELLPMLQRFNPKIVAVLCRQADILREEDRWLEEATTASLRDLVTQPADDRITMDRKAFLALPVAMQRRLVRRILTQLRGGWRSPGYRTITTVCDQLTRRRPWGTITLKTITVQRDYDLLHFTRIPAGEPPVGDRPLPQRPVPSESVALALPGRVRWPPTGEDIQVRCETRAAGEDAEAVPRSRRRAVFDADLVGADLRIRAWRPGDAFHPLGMAGHRKKLQDFFSDLKVPRAERRRVPLLVAEGGIVWVVGYRADHRFQPGPRTNRVLVAEVTAPV